MPNNPQQDTEQGKLLLATQDMKFSDVLEEMTEEDGLHHTLVYLIREMAASDPSNENALAEYANTLRQAAQSIYEALDEDLIFAKSLIDEDKA